MSGQPVVRGHRALILYWRSAQDSRPAWYGIECACGRDYSGLSMRNAKEAHERHRAKKEGWAA